MGKTKSSKVKIMFTSSKDKNSAYERTSEFLSDINSGGSKLLIASETPTYYTPQTIPGSPKHQTLGSPKRMMKFQKNVARNVSSGTMPDLSRRKNLNSSITKSLSDEDKSSDCSDIEAPRTDEDLLGTQAIRSDRRRWFALETNFKAVESSYLEGHSIVYQTSRSQDEVPLDNRARRKFTYNSIRPAPELNTSDTSDEGTDWEKVARAERRRSAMVRTNLRTLMVDLNAERQRVQKTMNQLRKQMEEVKMRELELEKASIIQEASMTKKANSDAQLKQLQQENTQLQSTVERLTTENTSLKNKFTETNSNQRQLIDELQRANSRLKVELKEAHDETTRLRRSVVEEKTQVQRAAIVTLEENCKKWNIIGSDSEDTSRYDSCGSPENIPNTPKTYGDVKPTKGPLAIAEIRPRESEVRSREPEVKPQTAQVKPEVQVKPQAAQVKPEVLVKPQEEQVKPPLTYSPMRRRLIASPSASTPAGCTPEPIRNLQLQEQTPPTLPFKSPLMRVPSSTVRKPKILLAIHNFESEDPEDLSFEEGDLLHLVQKDIDGWWVAEKSGIKGLIPSNFVEDLSDEKATRCTALGDLSAECEGDLSLSKGEIVYVVSQEGEWWIAYNSAGKYGYVPNTYVRAGKVL